MRARGGCHHPRHGLPYELGKDPLAVPANDLCTDARDSGHRGCAPSCSSMRKGSRVGERCRRGHFLASRLRRRRDRRYRAPPTCSHGGPCTPGGWLGTLGCSRAMSASRPDRTLYQVADGGSRWRALAKPDIPVRTAYLIQPSPPVSFSLFVTEALIEGCAHEGLGTRFGSNCRDCPAHLAVESHGQRCDGSAPGRTALTVTGRAARPAPNDGPLLETACDLTAATPANDQSRSLTMDSNGPDARPKRRNPVLTTRSYSRRV